MMPPIIWAWLSEWDLRSYSLRMDESAIMVFTSRDIPTMLRDGGSQAWKINAVRAASCKYLVATWYPRGAHTRSPNYRQYYEAFLVARITTVETADPAVEGPGRYIIRFDKAQEISVKNAWPKGVRGPFLYGSLDEFGISRPRF